MMMWFSLETNTLDREIMEKSYWEDILGVDNIKIVWFAKIYM